MQGWRLRSAWLRLTFVLIIGIGAPASARAANDHQDVGADEVRSERAVDSTENNVVGLNVARLRRDRYIWAAADLVNANGGDWGYLTVVFTADERDSTHGEALLQQLLDRCFEQHLQPIIRVTTRFDVRTETWSRPEPDDAERWRELLERGRWPTKRVWVIAGNEPNLGREWGGEVDSAAYAEYLSHFLDVFADSERFKAVNGPLDASNITEMPKMQDAFEFLAGMEAAVPGIFTRLAGWASNPYSVPHHGPGLRYTHRAYEAELEAIGRDMPVLITEAGHLNTGDEREIATFYEEAFRDWMADPRVVAVTPLFWHPDRGEYWMFDFDRNGQVVDKSPTYEVIRQLPRERGSPEYEPDVQNVARTGSSIVASRARADARTSVDAAGPGTVLQVANTEGQGVRLRAEPSREARSITVVKDGTQVEAIGAAAKGGGLTWQPVRMRNGAEGWIAVDFLTVKASNE
jgi:Bacterial SH3 domain